MAKAKLSKHAQLYVVQQLAMFERPTAVQKQLKELFEIEVALPAIVHYDISNPKLPPKWKEVFETTRKKFIEDTSAIPIAHKAFRLKELDSLYHRQKGSGLQNPVEMRAVLEQAAKESGNQFTNRTEHTGKGGKDLIPESAAAVVVYLPDNGRGDASVTVPPAEKADPAA